MVVTPEPYYALTMLPVTGPPAIFTLYDTLVKGHLWEEESPRIKLDKLCAPRHKKGGLGLPDLRLYYISFEKGKTSQTLVCKVRIRLGDY